MQWSTRAQDCLYVNWVLPRDTVPDLPAPLSYEVHRSGGHDVVFVSALLFHLSDLRAEALPQLRLSYPQMNLLLYVLDAEGRPAMLFHRMLVPSWVAPVSRWLGHQPTLSARLTCPRVSRRLGDESWHWSVQRRRRLAITCRLGSPHLGPGPDLGNWQQTLHQFRNRSRGYVLWGDRLRSIRATHSSDDAMPLAIDIDDAGLLIKELPESHDGIWQEPHSAWLCPEIPFTFELGKSIQLPLPGQRVAAAEGTSCRHRGGGG